MVSPEPVTLRLVPAVPNCSVSLLPLIVTESLLPLRLSVELSPDTVTLIEALLVTRRLVLVVPNATLSPEPWIATVSLLPVTLTTSLVPVIVTASLLPASPIVRLSNVTSA